MVSTTAGEGTSYEGGDGGVGKFRKRPFWRHQTTPYDRPSTTLRNPRNSGWLPKLVDPAYKLISASAHLFFSSVFRKRLPPPPRLPEANQESGNRLQEAVPNNPPRVQLPAIDDDDENPTNSCDSRGIAELEQLFKQKTFTRSEIDRLTELLRSKTSDLPNRHEDTRNESNVRESVSAFERKDEYAGNPKQENRTGIPLESHRCDGHVTAPVISSKLLEEDVATPAELAKAYMGSRPSEASPSVLGLRGQTLKEDSNLLKNLPFPPKSPVTSLVSKPVVRVGVPENGFMTPRTRGRSAIYHMARTPYSRVTQKGSGSTYDGYGGPPASSSQYAWEIDGQHGSKQLALKRRSSVLEDDIGSVGPIRRLRQKTILSTPKSLSLWLSGSSLSKRGSGIGSDTSQTPSSSTYKLFSLDEPKRITSITAGENADNNIASTSLTPFPSKSTEMAARILQQLEKLAPKEKSSEGKVVIVREKSPSKLTSNMRRGQDLRSLDDVDSSKVLQNVQDSHKLEDLHKACLPDARDINSQKRDNIGENVLKMSGISREPVAPSMFSATTISVKDAPSSVKPVDSAITPCLARTSQQKRAFQMSAHELDDDHSNEAASTPVVGRKEKLETCKVVSDAASVEAVTVNNSPVLSEIKTFAGPLLKKPINLGISDAPVASEKNTSFTIPTASFPGATFQPVVDTPQPTSAFDKIVPLKDPNAPPPLFISSLKNVDKVPSLTFSSSSSVTESLGLKSGASLESRPENSNSLGNVASGTSDTVPKIPELNKGDDKNVQKSLDMMGKSETSRSVSTSSLAHSIFSFGAAPNNSSLNNGSVPSSPSIFSSPASVLASNNLTTKTFTNSLTNVASSTTSTMTTSGATTTTAFSSSISTSAVAPSFPAAPVLKFGSSIATSSSVPTVSITPTAETTDLKATTGKETTSGNPSSSPFSGISFGMPSTASSIFGFGASATSSSANNMSQVSPFGTTTGSLAGTQVPPVATGVAAATQSMPIQFGSSTSSLALGTSGTTTSTSSLFGSSTPSIFGASTSFGPCSSASSSETNPSVATSSLFASSWQPGKSPVFNSTFNSGSQSAGFSFGGSSVSAAASNSAPMVFASSTSASSSSIFSFTSAAATTSQVQPIFSCSSPAFTAASGDSDQVNMEDSMAEDPVQSSRPTIPVFGHPSTSTPPSGFVFGSQTPSGGVPFQFGGQQSQSTPQNPSPFQPSGSLPFGAGDSFSLGSGGGDKSGRKIVKVKHKNRRR